MHRPPGIQTTPVIQTGQPYQTQNTSLATIMGTCGVPFWTEDGVASGVYSIYTRDMLLRIDGPDGEPKYEGWNLEEAVEDAWRSGIPGMIVYRFIYGPLLERIKDAYTKHEQLMAELERAAGNLPTESGGMESGEIDIEPETATRFACQLLKNRKIFQNEWKNHAPMIVVEGKTKTTREGEKMITVGSMKAYPLFAPAEVRKRLKL